MSSDTPLTLPVLYSFRRCPYAIRARMALAYTGIAVELREVKLRDKPESMLALSPKGTVPVLQLPDGRVLDESLQIMQWALSQRDPDDWQGTEPDACADLIQYNDSAFKPQLDRYKYFERNPQKSQRAWRDDAESYLARLNEALAINQGAGLVRNTPSLADYAIFPFLRQFRGVDAEWFDAAPYSDLIAWLRAHESSELFLGVMKKWPVWKPSAGVGGG